MKIAICYPPLPNDRGTPLLGQNRQFQWFSDPTYIYPMVPASAATLLKQNGHEVLWLDGIAEELSYPDFLRALQRFRPDLVAMETKTPVIKMHWRIIADIAASSTTDWKPHTALMGDHVTALPDETMRNSEVDFVLTGGDYDFLLSNLCDYLSRPAHSESVLEPGVWYRTGAEIRNTGPFRLDHDLDSLPPIDRELTKWAQYSQKNGNYRSRPGTYTMAARDCWWGRCSFCAWTVLYPGKDWRTRSPKSLLDEVGALIENYGVKEIMDDSGTFPVGNWLRDFCEGMVERGYNKRVALSCNMRFGALQPPDWTLMKKAGFRFVLFGLESANNETLDRLHKNLKIERVESDLRMAKRAGLEPHITVMVGYPWESHEDTSRTLGLARRLFSRGLVDTLQATIVVPYPGTALFRQCRDEDWLKTTEWERYDMRGSVMKSPMTDEELQRLTQGLYKSFITPRFVARKVMSVRSLDDIRYLHRAGKAVFGHLKDFMRPGREEQSVAGSSPQDGS